MNKLENRRKYDNKASKNLACLSNAHLLTLLAKVKLMEGIGGTSALMDIEDLDFHRRKRSRSKRRTCLSKWFLAHVGKNLAY